MQENDYDCSPTVTISHEKHSRVLIEGLWNFLINKYRVEDVAWGGGVFKVHQLIFDVFIPPEKKIESLAISDELSCYLGALLEFVYKGTVALGRERLDGLLLLAKELDFQLLVDAILASSSRHINAKDVGVTNAGSRVQDHCPDPKSSTGGQAKRMPVSVESRDPIPQVNKVRGLPAKRNSLTRPWEPEIKINSRSDVRQVRVTRVRQRSVSISNAVAVRCKKSAHKRAPISKFKCPECKFVSSNSNVVHGHQAVVHSNEKQFKCEKCDFVTSWKFVLTRHVYKLHQFPGYQYFCSICQQRFDSGKELDDHLTTHEEVGTFRCPHCELAFTQNKFLVAHIGRVHTGRDGDGGFQCDVCAKWYKSRWELDSHYRAHTQELPFKCPHCDKRFNYASNRTSHIARKHAEEGIPCNFSCDTCGKLLASRQTLVEHQRTHSQERPFKCPHCDKSFKSEIVAKEHVDKVHAAQGAGHLPHGCPHCERRFNHSFKLMRHVKRNHGRNFPCENCGKMFQSNADLVAHQRNHSDDLRHSCVECDKRFSDTSNLRVHVARVHRQGPDNFACDFCFEEFKSSVEMVQHRKSHLEEKFHECQHCKRRFKFENGLKKHVVRDHSLVANKKKLTPSSVSCICEMCGRLCRSRKALRSHQQTHVVNKKKKANSRKFKCSQCDYAVDSQRRLAIHQEVVHEVGPARFTCETCSKRCGSRVSLERHTRTHTKEKPFKCELCPCTFAVKMGLKQHLSTIHRMGKFRCETCNRTYPCVGQLNKHQRSHTKEKPYQCPHCDLRVSQSDNLATHIKVVHGSVKYACETCGKSLNSERQLGRHRLSHNKVKKNKFASDMDSRGSSFTCNVCGVCFSSEDNLSGHRLLHAPDCPIDFVSHSSDARFLAFTVT